MHEDQPGLSGLILLSAAATNYYHSAHDPYALNIPSPSRSHSLERIEILVDHANISEDRILAEPELARVREVAAQNILQKRRYRSMMLGKREGSPWRVGKLVPAKMVKPVSPRTAQHETQVREDLIQMGCVGLFEVP